ncbi:hypothetical protein PCAR4_810019 [Paraburkholderia caribensis]|nr:hypothetical protein PCAR4_810019 [Paraburkholderia caribensis]
MKHVGITRMPAQTQADHTPAQQIPKPKPKKAPQAQFPHSRLPFFVFYFSTQTTKTTTKPNRTGPSSRQAVASEQRARAGLAPPGAQYKSVP